MNQFKVELAMELLGCKINFYRPGEFYGSYLEAIIPRPYEESIKPDGIPEGIGIYVKNLLRGGEVRRRLYFNPEYGYCATRNTSLKHVYSL